MVVFKFGVYSSTKLRHRTRMSLIKALLMDFFFFFLKYRLSTAGCCVSSESAHYFTLYVPPRHMGVLQERADYRFLFCFFLFLILSRAHRDDPCRVYDYTVLRFLRSNYCGKTDRKERATRRTTRAAQKRRPNVCTTIIMQDSAYNTLIL